MTRSKVTYIGRREEDGTAKVLKRVENEGMDQIYPLAPMLTLANHSPTGFEWGYGGSGPAQLALAIVADTLHGENQRALSLYQQFKHDMIATLPRNGGWQITRARVELWLKEQDQKERDQRAREGGGL